MNYKRLLLVVLISLCMFLCYADSYKLSVTNADDMTASEKFINLEGNVHVSFVTTDSDNNVERNLIADRVIIDVDKKCLDAIGNVSLKEGNDSSFLGDSLSLNWDTLDIVVFGGTSSSERTGSSGNTVRFFIQGDRISYAGKNDSVFFQDGIISTTEFDPYWSINAKKIGLVGSDLFFVNATLKLGRVPVFWIPAFFYPGNRLSFNPAIGMSSTKGAFLNTTYEIYGSYPNIGASGLSSSTSDAGAMATNFLSFMESEESEKMIRSGWTYIPQSKAENLSNLQKWAIRTGSYFAVMADVWQNYGFSIGFDTKNNLFDNKLKVNSYGLLNYNNSCFRYAFNFDSSFSFSNMKFTLNVPVLSDPDVRYDLLNRNTVFGLDAVFGAYQSFPKTYSDNDSKYSIILDGSASEKVGIFNLNINSLKAQIDYEWDKDYQKYKLKTSMLPYVSFSSSATLLDFKGKDDSSKKFVLGNKTAQEFYDEFKRIENDIASDSYGQDSNLTLIQAGKIENLNTDSKPGSFRIDYSYNQVLENDYEVDMKHTSFSTKIDASINANGNTKANWFGFKESLKPVYSFSTTENEGDSQDFKLKNNASISIPRLGLTYGLENYLYILEQSASKDISRTGKWDKKDVLSHYISFNKSFSFLSASLKFVLPPLDLVLTPSLTYERGILKAHTDIGFDKDFKPTKAHLNLYITDPLYSLKIENTEDFKKNGWNGFSTIESLTINLLDKKLKLSQNLSLESKFILKELQFGANYGKNSVSISFKDREIKPDKLKLDICQSFNPVYAWSNRIGFEGSLDFGLNYDFQNKYSTSLYADAKLNLAIYKFLDVAVSVRSINNSFYRYYDGENFNFNYLWSDLAKSFDFFGDGRKSTGFNLSSFSVSAVHYLEDWKLTFTSASSVKTEKGKKVFVPEFTILVQWNAIPELKTNYSWEK